MLGFMDYVESFCAAFLQAVDTVLHFLVTDPVVQAIVLVIACILIGGFFLVCLAGMFGLVD